jgi:hypothetical protein
MPFVSSDDSEVYGNKTAIIIFLDTLTEGLISVIHVVGTVANDPSQAIDISVYLAPP